MIYQVSVLLRYRKTCLHHMMVKIVPFSKNVQVSRLLPELCGRHVVVHGPSGYARQTTC